MINRLMREKKLLEAQLRDANNLADQWAQRNIALEAENARLRAELEQSRDLIVEMSKHCNATALVADWLERNT